MEKQKGQKNQKDQVSTKEERFTAIKFIRHVFEFLGLGSDVTDSILDLVIEKLYDDWDYYVGNRFDEMVDEERRAIEEWEKSQEIEERNKKVIQRLTEKQKTDLKRCPFRSGATVTISNKVSLIHWD